MADENARAFSSVGEILGKSRALNNKRRLSWHQWREVVGGRVASRSRPQFLDGQTLTVLVASSTWSQELSFLQPLILEELAKHGLKITTLRFRVGKVDAPHQEALIVRPAKEELPETLNLSLAKVDDPALRQAIADAAAYSLPVQKASETRAAAAQPPGAGTRPPRKT